LKQKFFFLFFISILFNVNLKADRYPYRDSVEIRVEGKLFIVYHYHNWNIRLEQIQKETLKNPKDSILSSSLTCINKISGDTIFCKPSPAFTSIIIDKKQKYIICASNIKRDNPFQLCIYDFKGNLLKRRNFSRMEAKLNQDQYIHFKTIYPLLNDSLSKAGNVYKVDSAIFIDFFNLENDSAWYFLSNFRTKNHISENISGTVSNHIYWYYYESIGRGQIDIKNGFDPDFVLHYKRNKPKYLSFYDPKGVRRKIYIKE